MQEEHQLCWMTLGARETKFHDCLSVVTITEQFTKEYMDVFMKYPINARLVDKTATSKQ